MGWLLSRHSRERTTKGNLWQIQIDPFDFRQHFTYLQLHKLCFKNFNRTKVTTTTGKNRTFGFQFLQFFFYSGRIVLFYCFFIIIIFQFNWSVGYALLSSSVSLAYILLFHYAGRRYKREEEIVLAGYLSFLNIENR